MSREEYDPQRHIADSLDRIADSLDLIVEHLRNGYIEEGT